MSHNEITGIKYLFPLIALFLMLSCYLPFRVVAAAETEGAEKSQALDEADLRIMQSSVDELKLLAPKLRVLLRTLRQRVGFDPREVHKVEQGLGRSLKDLERMVAMHQRKAFNKMRAHFMVNDLRRKAEGLEESLGYVKRRIRELTRASARRQVDAKLKQRDDDLVKLLGHYSELVSGSVTLLQEKGI